MSKSNRQKNRKRASKGAGQGKATKGPERPLFEPNAAGIDIGAREIFVAVPADRDAHPVRKFETFTEDLQRMAQWLVSSGVTTAAIAYASHCTSVGR
jgi:hypothetical protein